MNLETIGWNETIEEQFGRMQVGSCTPARISAEQKNHYEVIGDFGTRLAVLADTLWYNTFQRYELPVVGDCVALAPLQDADRATIVGILPRKSQLTRKAMDSYGRNFSKSGTSELQVISANIDVVVTVMAMDRDFNERKLERYLVLMYDSGANPLIVLNKADDCDNPNEYVARAEGVAYGVPVLAMSARLDSGVDALRRYLHPGETVTFIGSSGVGKSTLINTLIGRDAMYVNAVRDADHRGRHTTTYRQLIPLPGGAVLIDNPGMRDIKVQGSEELLDTVFADIVTLATQCKFRNCSHQTEPGCAIQAAIANGRLDEGRLVNYRKLQREMHYLEARSKKRQNYLDNARSKQKLFGIKLKKHRQG
jgi:ribosome biogenesis GTPase